MNKITYLSFVLTVCMGVTSLSLVAAEHSVIASQPENIATLKEKAAYHKAMAEHYRSLVAAEYEKGEHAELKKQIETLSNELQKVKPK